MKKMPTAKEEFFQTTFSWTPQQFGRFYTCTYDRLEKELWVSTNARMKRDYDALFSDATLSVSIYFDNLVNVKGHTLVSEKFPCWENIYKYFCKVFINTFLQQYKKMRLLRKEEKQYATYLDSHGSNELFNTMIMGEELDKVLQHVDKVLASNPYMLSPQELRYYKIYRVLILDPTIEDLRSVICSFMDISDKNYAKLKSNVRSAVEKIIFNIKFITA